MKKTYEIWSEGYQVTGESSGAVFFGTGEGENFDEAVQDYINNHPKSIIEKVTPRHFSSLDYYNARRSNWRCWGCSLFATESEARKSFG